MAEWCTTSARDAGMGGPTAFLFALPNPNPDKPIQSLILEPVDSSAIYGICLTQLREHPLRFQPRRKLCLTLSRGVYFNKIEELDDIEFDLGNVISARRQFIYDHKRWKNGSVDVQPQLSDHRAVIEYTAHPAGKLYLRTEEGQQVYDLNSLSTDVVEISPALYMSRFPEASKLVQSGIHLKLMPKRLKSALT